MMLPEKRFPYSYTTRIYTPPSRVDIAPTEKNLERISAGFRKRNDCRILC